MYTIGQLSQKTNIPISTLRYYDELGILKPAQVADSGYRYYSNEELRILHHITALKELGFTLSAIKELLAAEKSDKEFRWKAYLEFELEAIAKQKDRLDELEKLLQTTKYALEMKGEIEPEDIFLFIQAMRTPAGIRESFLAKHFTERESRIIRNLPNLNSDDPRSMQWAKLVRAAKDHLHEPPSSEMSQKLARQFVEISMDWFEQDEQLIEKYWALIRPEQDEQAKVFGMDREVMDYIDSIVDWYLANVQKESMHEKGKTD
ncbi:MerR family transcriptional regulator [Paenibacillus medicaginis]|uniref:MerR family transcriptional regulator n=1 Tax=Paenibacillus medicaginis TaxID=1470560 RepID=A0ABV5C1J5_9BACL